MVISNISEENQRRLGRISALVVFGVKGLDGMKKQIGFLLLAFVLMVSACGSPVEETSSISPEESRTEDQIEFTDAFGQAFSITRPKRVVAIIGSFADIWCLAGGEGTLVGTANDAWESFGLELGEHVTNLGSAMKPSLELILAAQPDLVIASSISPSNLEMKEAFDQAKIPAAYFDVASFDDYLALLEICTRLTGKTENFASFGTEIQERVEKALSYQDGSHPTVLSLQVSGSSCKVKNSEGNILGEMLAALGCVNVADQDGALLEDLSLEAIITADPDYIFAVFHGTDTAEAQANLESTLLSNPAWSNLRAVREGRFYTMDRRHYNLKPNALWGEAYEKLSEILYG